MLINLLAFMLFLVLWGMFLYYQIKQNNFLFITILVCFAQQYIIPQVYYFSQWTIVNRYFPVTESDYFNMIYCCVIFIIALFVGQMCVRTQRFEQSKEFFTADSNYNLGKIKIILLAISIIAILLQFRNFSQMFNTNSLQNRLIENQGSGYLQFLNVTSYFIVFIGIKQFLSGEISMKFLLIHSMPAFIIYSLKLQRGHAIYPLFFIFLAYIFTKIKPLRASLIVAAVAVAILYVGNLTNIIRTTIVDKTEYAEARNKVQNVIPASYAHSELLCAVTADKRINDLPSTLWGAIVNWVPRSIYKSKPKTLGPILNNQYTPDNSFYRLKGIHRSSYTTDLLIEGFYHMRYVGVFIFGLVFSIIASLLWQYVTLEKNKEFFFMSFPLTLFIIGFIGFFSDMGNWIGYIVIYYGVYFVIKFFAQTKKIYG